MDNDFKVKQKLNAAADFKSLGKYLHAIQLCEQLLIEHPNEPDVYHELAELYKLSGNLNSAFDLIERYLGANPLDINMKLFYGQFLLQNKEWQKAVDILSQIIPEENPLVLFFLGYSYFMIKDYELARINFLSFLSHNNEQEMTHEANIYLAKIEIEMNDFEQALFYAKQSELLYASYWELYMIYAICYYNLGMDTHAVLAIEKSLKLNPKNVASYEWAGKVYLRTGDYLKAEKYFNEFVESSEFISSEIYSGLGEACLNRNKIDLALNYFELALKINPENKIALQGKKNITEGSK